MLDSIEHCLRELKKGKMIIVVDGENRENEGDLLMPAQNITSEQVNFMTKYGRGLICAPLTDPIARRLELSAMTEFNTDQRQTAFTISVDYKESTTGISTRERAMTLRQLANPIGLAGDFIRPGHIFPLVAKQGGVNTRPGHTEAAVDFAKLAGFEPVGVICEILNEDGSCARLPQLEILAKEHGLALTSIELLAAYKENLYKELELQGVI